MAKITLTFEDSFKDGQPVVVGKFVTDDAPAGGVNGMPGLSTPAMMFGATIHRLWNRGVIGALAPLICPDVVYKNDLIMQASKRSAAPAPVDLDADLAGLRADQAQGTIVEGTGVGKRAASGFGPDDVGTASAKDAPPG